MSARRGGLPRPQRPDNNNESRETGSRRREGKTREPPRELKKGCLEEPGTPKVTTRNGGKPTKGWWLKELAVQSWKASQVGAKR